MNSHLQFVLTMNSLQYSLSTLDILGLQLHNTTTNSHLQFILTTDSLQYILSPLDSLGIQLIQPQKQPPPVSSHHV